MIEVALEDAYGEACQALGEQVVRERLLMNRLAELEQENAALTAVAKASTRPATDRV